MNPSDSPVGEKTSVLLRRVLRELPDTDVRIGYLVLQLRRRSFGGLLIFLAALGLLPGISVLAGLAMIVPGLQMAAGFRAPVLPRFVRKRKIDTQKLRELGDKTAQLIEWSERFVRPRWLFMTLPIMASIIGILVTALALVVMIPLPFTNFCPALALLCLSLGILERDGLLILLGILIGATALTIGALIVSIAIESLMPVVEKYFW